MSSTTTASNTTAPTQLLKVNDHSYAYRRFGGGPGLPLLFLQHFTGTLDNWDPAVTDPLAAGREVILFDNAGLGAAPAGRSLRRARPWRAIPRPSRCVSWIREVTTSLVLVGSMAAILMVVDRALDLFGG